MFDPLIAFLQHFFWLDVLLFFLLGLALGSFTSCLTYRVPRKIAWIWDKDMRGHGFLGGVPARSFCPECRTTLTSKDLIPVLSWILSGGRCRYCDTKISIRYPLFELSCGVVCAMLVFLLPQDYTMRVAIAAALPFVVSFLMIWREHHYASFPMFIVSACIGAVYFGLSFG